MKYAFFDVDNTLYDGYSASELIEHIDSINPNPDLKKRYLDSIEDYKLRKISYNEISQIALDLLSESLKGLSKEKARSYITQMLSAKSKVFNEWVGEVITHLKEHDFEIILVSAGPDVTVEELSNRLHVEQWYATGVPISNDVYEGSETNLLNEEKKSELIDMLLSDKEVTMSIGFGDSIGDIPMLERVDHAFVFQNGNDVQEEIMQHAEKKAWTVFSNSAQVISLLEK